MKIKWKSLSMLPAYIMLVLIVANLFYTEVGFDVEVKTGSKEQVTLTQTGFYIPFLVNVKILKNESLDYQFSTYNNVFADSKIEFGGTFSLGPSSLKTNNFMTGSFQNIPMQEGGIRSTFLIGFVDETVDVEFQFFSASKSAIESHDSGVQITEHAMDQDMMSYYVEFTAEISSMEAWLSFYQSMEGTTDTESLEAILRSSMPKTDVHTGSSRFWVFVATRTQYSDGKKENYSVFGMPESESGLQEFINKADSEL